MFKVRGQSPLSGRTRRSSRLGPLSWRVSSASPRQAHSRHHGCSTEVGLQLGVPSEAGPHLPATWLGARLASRASWQDARRRAQRFQTSSWQDKDCPVPAKVSAGPGSGQRPEVAHERERLTFAARAGNGQTVKEALECGPSVPAPVPPGDRSPEQEVPSRKGFRLLLRGCLPVGASRCHLRVPAGGFLGGLRGRGWRNREPWGPASASTHVGIPLCVPAWCTGPWECTPSLSGLGALGIHTSHRCHSFAHTNISLGMLLPMENFYSALRTQLGSSSWIKLFLKQPSPADAAPSAADVAPSPVLWPFHSPRSRHQGAHPFPGLPSRPSTQNTQLVPSVCWAWRCSTCGFSWPRDGPGTRARPLSQDTGVCVELVFTPWCQRACVKPAHRPVASHVRSLSHSVLL